MAEQRPRDAASARWRMLRSIVPISQTANKIVPSTETALPDLADLDRPALEHLFEAAGLPRFRARQVFRSDLPQGRDRRRANAQPRRDGAGRNCQAVPHQHAASRTSGSVGRRHPEVPAAPRRRASHRSGVHPRHPEADVLHLQPGRLRDGLRFLPDGEDGVHASPDAGGDRRPGPRARPRDRPSRRALQHRPHGHGRAAAQLRRGDDVDADSRATSKGSRCRRGA